MKRTLIYAAVIAALLPGMATVAMAADQTRDQTRLQTQAQIRDDQIYGSQLMTQQERNEYRARLGAAKTVQQQEQIRNEHHKQMQARARERGVKLPDVPPARGGGMGPGPGPGGGMGPGPGGGMGPGGGGGPHRY